MNDPGVPIVRHKQRARRREHRHLAKMPQISQQTHSILASRPVLRPHAGTAATGCLPDGPPVGIIIASGRLSGGMRSGSGCGFTARSGHLAKFPIAKSARQIEEITMQTVESGTVSLSNAVCATINDKPEASSGESRLNTVRRLYPFP